MNQACDVALIPVATDTLGYGRAFDFDLYLRPARGEAPVLYRARSFPLSTGDIESLAQRNVRTLYISAASLAAYESYLREQVLSGSGASPAARVSALKAANRAVFLDALRNNQMGAVVDMANDLGADLAETLCDHEGVFEQVFGVLSHDYYTYTHITNVCVYSLALAQALGIGDHATLAAIAAGALLHDVGKRTIPSSILNKNGRLTDEEFRVVKLHPRTGFTDLCRRDDLTRSQLLMVYQHHERLDGRGYPAQVADDEIDPWARICTIADVFDALTSHRPYRKPMARTLVRQYFIEHAGSAFDEEMIRCWIEVLDHTIWKPC